MLRGFSVAFGIMIEINYYIQEAIMGAYKDKNGTWFASARYKNWAGEAKRKMKRGFPTKREALAWEREFIAKNDGNLEMTFQSFYEVLS